MFISIATPLKAIRPVNPAYRQDFSFGDVSLDQARQFFRKYHYARSCSNTAVLLQGVFSKKSKCLVVVAHWIPPTKTCARSVDLIRWRRILSLSRLAILPGEPTNLASMLIGHCLRLLRRESRWIGLVTFADESQGHLGTIYRATNWTYVGPTKPEVFWTDPLSGKRVSRLSTKSRTKTEMESLGYVSDKSIKHKFVMMLKGPLFPDECQRGSG